MNTVTPKINTSIPQNHCGLDENDMAAILGVNPFKTAYEVYKHKVEGKEPLLPSSNQTLWEPIKDLIADYYTKTTGYKLCCTGIAKHEQYPFLITEPHRLVMYKPLGLEIKVLEEHHKHLWEQDGSPLIPAYDYIQIAHRMLVLGYSLWDIAILIEGKEFKIYTVEQDKALEAILIEEGLKFWTNHIEKQCPPPLDYTHPNAKELIQRQFNVIAEESVALSMKFLPLVSALKKTYQKLNKYQQLKDNLENHLLEGLQKMEETQVINKRLSVKELTAQKNYLASKTEAVTLRLQEGERHE